MSVRRSAYPPARTFREVREGGKQFRQPHGFFRYWEGEGDLLLRLAHLRRSSSVGRTAAIGDVLAECGAEASQEAPGQVDRYGRKYTCV